MHTSDYRPARTSPIIPNPVRFRRNTFVFHRICPKRIVIISGRGEIGVSRGTECNQNTNLQFPYTVRAHRYVRFSRRRDNAKNTESGPFDECYYGENTISICTLVHSLLDDNETDRRAPCARNGVRRRDEQISREICDRYTPIVAKRRPSGVGQQHVAPRIIVPVVVYVNRDRFLCC